MKNIFVHCLLSSCLATSAAYADSYQKLLSSYNERGSAESLYEQIGTNLSKRVATEAERSNLSFIAIYGGAAQWTQNSLSNKIEKLTQNSNDYIGDNSLEPNERRYRIEHYVNLVVLCTASHLRSEQKKLPDLNKILDAIGDNARNGLMNSDVFARLLSLSAGDIDKILKDYNFEESYQLATKDMAFYESRKGTVGKMPGSLLYLLPNKKILYQETLQALDDFESKTHSSASASSANVSSSGKSGTSKAKPHFALDDVLKKKMASGPKVPAAADDKPDAAADALEEPQKSLASLFVGGGGDSKAKKMLEKSLADAKAGGSSSSRSTVSPDTVVNAPEAGEKWTVERLQADAIRQIDESTLSDDLTEDAYDADENEIKISPKEKARRDTVKFIKINNGGSLSDRDFAERIGTFLLKRGVAYNNPIKPAAPVSGYQRQEKPKEVTKKQESVGIDMNEMRQKQERIVRERDKKEAEKAGLTVEAYKERKRIEEEERENRAKEAELLAVEQRAQKESQPVLSEEEKRQLFEEKLLVRNQLSREINRITQEKKELQTSLQAKQAEINTKQGRLGSGKNTISEEDKELLRNKMAENQARIRDIEEEIRAIEEADAELKNIPQQIKDVDRSALNAREKTKKREELSKRQNELDDAAAARARKTRKSQITSERKDLQATIDRDQRQLDSGNRAEALQAEITKLEGELRAIEKEISQLDTQIRKLKGDQINIFLSAGLTAAEIEIFENKHDKEVQKRSMTHNPKVSNILVNGMGARRKSMGHDQGGNDSGEESESDDDA